MKRERVSARVRANRQNARRSTGPRSVSGKARVSGNASIHGLRGGGIFHDDPRVARLASLITGRSAPHHANTLAAAVAEAHLEVMLARRLSAAAWSILGNLDESERNIAASIDDPVLADIYDPLSRAELRGDGPIDDVERKLVARIEAYALRLRRKKSNTIMRRLLVLSRYEGRALSRLRAAQATYVRLMHGELMTPENSLLEPACCSEGARLVADHRN